jgi:hypothetical protein
MTSLTPWLVGVLAVAGVLRAMVALSTWRARRRAVTTQRAQTLWRRWLVDPTRVSDQDYHWLVAQVASQPSLARFDDAVRIGRDVRGGARDRWIAVLEEAGVVREAYRWVQHRGPRRLAGLRVLAAVGAAPHDHQVVTALLHDGDARVRAEALAWLVPLRALPDAQLLEAARDSHPMVRARAMELLPNSGLAGEAIASRLMAGNDATIESAVARAFAAPHDAVQDGDTDTTRRLVRALIPLLHAEDATARLTAERALAGTGRAGRLLLASHRRVPACP